MYVHDMMSESLNGLQCFTYLGRKIKKIHFFEAYLFSFTLETCGKLTVNFTKQRFVLLCSLSYFRDRTKLAIGKHSADFMDQSVCEWMNRNMKFRMLYFAVVEPSFWSCCPEKRLSKHWTGKNKLVLVTFSYQVNVWPMLSLHLLIISDIFLC